MGNLVQNPKKISKKGLVCSYDVHQHIWYMKIFRNKLNSGCGQSSMSMCWWLEITEILDIQQANILAALMIHFLQLAYTSMQFICCQVKVRCVWVFLQTRISRFVDNLQHSPDIKSDLIHSYRINNSKSGNAFSGNCSMEVLSPKTFLKSLLP